MKTPLIVYLTLPVVVVLAVVLAGCRLLPPLQHTPDFDFSVPHISGLKHGFKDFGVL